ncbi:MAG TPA: HAMP domain-containing sensor histidine kinase [Gemmatimonadaceae bacterium]|nr:HAMP domain-containing sensor histidine kinase [Gemmatimonadaceae bacterium]
MQGLIDRAPAGFISFADDGTVRDINTTLLEQLGVDRAAVVGKPFESLLTVASRIFYTTHLFPMLRLQSAANELFITMRCAGSGAAAGGGGDNDGSRGDVAFLASFTSRDAAGETLYDGVLMQLRERRKWEDELVRARRTAEEANRRNSALLSMMSHDLRTPIGSISGYAEILLMGIRGELTDAQRDDLQRVKKASEYVLGLIEDVLNFARLNAGEIAAPDLRTLTADAVVAETESLIGPRMEQSGIRYERISCDPSVKIIADPDRLQQILLNLLTNAVKFTPAGGRITITCASDGENTQISVADTGRGIPADQLEKIFEAFVQVTGTAAALSGRQKGFGLGLAISRGLARRMNGELTVRSEVGVGSTFTLRLPASRQTDSGDSAGV